MTLSDYLKFLGISFSASPQEINSAYRKLSRKFLSRKSAGEYFTGNSSRHKKLLQCFSDPRKYGYPENHSSGRFPGS